MSFQLEVEITAVVVPCVTWAHSFIDAVLVLLSLQSIMLEVVAEAQEEDAQRSVCELVEH